MTWISQITFDGISYTFAYSGKKKAINTLSIMESHRLKLENDLKSIVEETEMCGKANAALSKPSINSS